MCFFSGHCVKFKLPSAKNKQSIEKSMDATRMYRRNWILAKNPSISQVFNEYPRLLDFNGEMVMIYFLQKFLPCITICVFILLQISSDFENLFPKANDKFLTDVPGFYAPRILGYVKKYRPAMLKTSQLIKDGKINFL